MNIVISSVCEFLQSLILIKSDQQSYSEALWKLGKL